MWGSEFTSKDAALQGGMMVVLMPIVRGGARCASQVLHRCAQAVSRGAACCASQVLDRFAHADARGATHVLGRGVQAVARDTARFALHVHGRGARTDACGRSFAVLSAQVSAAGLRLGRRVAACLK